jgi:hypothetical protein
MTDAQGTNTYLLPLSLFPSQDHNATAHSLYSTTTMKSSTRLLLSLSIISAAAGLEEGRTSVRGVMEDPASPPRQLNTLTKAPTIAFVMDAADVEMRGDYKDSYPTHERKCWYVSQQTAPRHHSDNRLSLSQPPTNQATTANPPNLPRILEARVTLPRKEVREEPLNMIPTQPMNVSPFCSAMERIVQSSC